MKRVDKTCLLIKKINKNKLINLADFFLAYVHIILSYPVFNPNANNTKTNIEAVCTVLTRPGFAATDLLYVSTYLCNSVLQFRK